MQVNKDQVEQFVLNSLSKSLTERTKVLKLEFAVEYLKKKASNKIRKTQLRAALHKVAKQEPYKLSDQGVITLA